VNQTGQKTLIFTSRADRKAGSRFPPERNPSVWRLEWVILGLRGLRLCVWIPFAVGTVRPPARSSGVRQVPNKCAAFRQHLPIRAPYLLEFIESADWNAACLE
jgi:hypothetical protein